MHHQATVPSRLQQPLHIDTDLNYSLDMSKFPGLDDPQHMYEPALLIAEPDNIHTVTEEQCRDSHFANVRSSHCANMTAKSLKQSNKEEMAELLNIIDSCNTELLDRLQGTRTPDLDRGHIMYKSIMDACASFPNPPVISRDLNRVKQAHLTQNQKIVRASNRSCLLPNSLHDQFSHQNTEQFKSNLMQSSHRNITGAAQTDVVFPWGFNTIATRNSHDSQTNVTACSTQNIMTPDREITHHDSSNILISQWNLTPNTTHNTHLSHQNITPYYTQNVHNSMRTVIPSISNDVNVSHLNNTLEFFRTIHASSNKRNPCDKSLMMDYYQGIPQTRQADVWGVDDVESTKHMTRLHQIPEAHNQSQLNSVDPCSMVSSGCKRKRSMDTSDFLLLKRHCDRPSTLNYFTHGGGLIKNHQMFHETFQNTVLV